MENWLALVLIGTLTQWQGGEAQSDFTIDWMTLSLHPDNTVDSGTDVTLRCIVKVSHSFSKLMHNFNFLLNGVVIYSKNTSEDLVDHILSPARASNSGNYGCSVRINNKYRSSKPQRLSVLGLQTPELKVHPSSVFEGEDISVSCSALKETGAIQFFFYKNNDEFMQTTVSSNSVNTTVNMDEIGSNDFYCDYGLILHSDVGRSNKSNTVKIEVKELEMIPFISIQSSGDVVEGDRVDITCGVLNYSRSDFEVFLTKKNSLLRRHSGTFMYSFQATARDSGEYVCKSEKGSVQKKDAAQLSVADLFSKPVLNMSPSQVFEGENFSLSCKSSYVASQRISSTGVKYSLYKGQRLLSHGDINLVASQDNNGNYSCRAEAKGISKNSTHLVINAKVPVSTPVIRAVGKVIVGKQFQLECESKHGTFPITYTLLRPQTPPDTKTVTKPPRIALFNVSINHRDDINSFTCQAHNQGSRHSKTSPYMRADVIELVSMPKLTLNTKGDTVTEGTDLILKCSVSQGTAPITFTWYRFEDYKPLYTERIKRMHGEHIIRSISREQRGSYYCEASNDANVAQKSIIITIGVNMAIWKKILIAVFCIVLVVLITVILVIALKKAQTPRKRKRATELSVKSTRTKSSDPMRISLTLDIEDNTAVNGTPGVMGRNVWSENVSDSESGDQSGEEEKQKLQYTDVIPPHTVDDGTVPMLQDTDAVKDEVQDSTQGAMEQGQDPSLEYVQINHNDQEPE